MWHFCRKETLKPKLYTCTYFVLCNYNVHLHHIKERNIMQCIESLWLSLEKLNKNSPPPPPPHHHHHHKQSEMLQTQNMHNFDTLMKHCT